MTFTVAVNVPVARGVPATTPVVGAIVIPGGRPVADHAYGVVPAVAVTAVSK